MDILEKQITEYRVNCAGCGISEVINTGYDYHNIFYGNLNKQNAEAYFKELGWTERYDYTFCPHCSDRQRNNRL